MLTYSDKEMKDYYESIYGSTKSFVPIGHHQIGRNLVYLIDDQLIFKVYFKPDKAINELKSIPLLKDIYLVCPEVIGHGQVPHGEDYIVFKKLNGVILETVEEKLSMSELELIYYDMGKTLGKIHTIQVPHLYDAWSLNDENNHCKSLKTMMIYNINRFYKRIQPEDHEDYALIKAGYDYIMNHLDVFEGDHEVVLSHHDFSRRNVLVVKRDVHQYHGLIDFEHTKPSDLDLELVDTYLPLLEKDKALAKTFLEGYTSIKIFDEDRFLRKLHHYNIFIGIVTCSWAKEKAYDYYLTGLDKIRSSLKTVT